MALLHPPTLHPRWTAVNRQHSCAWLQTVVVCGQTRGQKVSLWWSNGDPQWHDSAMGRVNHMRTRSQNTLLLCTTCNSPVQPITNCTSLGGYAAVTIFPATHKQKPRTCGGSKSSAFLFPSCLSPFIMSSLPFVTLCPQDPGSQVEGWMKQANAVPGWQSVHPSATGPKRIPLQRQPMDKVSRHAVTSSSKKKCISPYKNPTHSCASGSYQTGINHVSLAKTYFTCWLSEQNSAQRRSGMGLRSRNDVQALSKVAKVL